jgi:hypothetical protein
MQKFLKKQERVAKGTRRGRIDLAWSMTQPLLPSGLGMEHPCTGCGHWENNDFCENLVHAKPDIGRLCWHPDGTLAVADEREGQKFLTLGV